MLVKEAETRKGMRQALQWRHNGVSNHQPHDFYPTVYSGVDQRKHQSSASLAFVRRIHRWPVNSPHKWPVTRKMFPFDDVIMKFHTCYRQGCILQRQATTGYWVPCEFTLSHQKTTPCQTVRCSAQPEMNPLTWSGTEYDGFVWGEGWKTINS